MFQNPSFSSICCYWSFLFWTYHMPLDYILIICYPKCLDPCLALMMGSFSGPVQIDSWHQLCVLILTLFFAFWLLLFIFLEYLNAWSDIHCTSPHKTSRYCWMLYILICFYLVTSIIINFFINSYYFLDTVYYLFLFSAWFYVIVVSCLRHIWRVNIHFL